MLKLELSCDSFVGLIEKLKAELDAMERALDSRSPAPAPVAPPRVSAPVDAEVSTPQAEWTTPYRERIKAELDALGITYGGKQRTAYLAELLERSRGKVGTPPAVALASAPIRKVNALIIENFNDIQLDTEEKEEKTVIDMGKLRKEAAAKAPVEMKAPTLDSVREQLTVFAKANGADKARTLLAKYKASKLSELSPEQLTDLAAVLSPGAPDADLFG